MMSDERCMKKINVKVTFFLSIIAVVMLAAGILCGHEVWLYEHPEIRITFSCDKRENIYRSYPFALFVADLISDRDMRYVMMRKYSSSGMQQGKCFNGLTKSMIPHYPCHRM